MLFNSFILATAGLSMIDAIPTKQQKRANGFTFFGVSESGAEFGETKIPGVYGTDYTFPDTSTIDTLIADGMNTFRIPFLMERMTPSTMTAACETSYLSNLTTVVNHITDKGSYAILDPHNYARYSGSVITSTSDFKTFWTTLAGHFKTNERVIFDCNNEPHDMPTVTLPAELAQACIDGVRASGATTQYIFVEGTSYTGAHSWTSSGNAANMGNLTDTADKIVYEMHQYLDSDFSGTSATCTSSTILSESMADATAWLKANNKKGVLGEFAGGANSVCKAAITDGLTYLQTNSDVWMGALWWAAGPWWASTNYMFSFEPAAGTGYTNYLSILKPFFPSASTSAANGSSTTGTTASSGYASVAMTGVTSTPAAKVQAATPTTSTSEEAETPVESATPPADTATPMATGSVSSGTGSYNSTTTTEPLTGSVELYGQCGGSDWTGATECADGTCTAENDFYSQCV